MNPFKFLKLWRAKRRWAGHETVPFPRPSGPNFIFLCSMGRLAAMPNPATCVVVPLEQEDEQNSAHLWRCESLHEILKNNHEHPMGRRRVELVRRLSDYECAMILDWNPNPRWDAPVGRAVGRIVVCWEPVPFAKDKHLIPLSAHRIDLIPTGDEITLVSSSIIRMT